MKTHSALITIVDLIMEKLKRVSKNVETLLVNKWVEDMWYGFYVTVEEAIEDKEPLPFFATWDTSSKPDIFARVPEGLMKELKEHKLICAEEDPDDDPSRGLPFIWFLTERGMEYFRQYLQEEVKLTYFTGTMLAK